MQLPPPSPSAPGNQPPQGQQPLREPSAFVFSLFCLLGTAMIGVAPLLGVFVLAFSAETLFVHKRTMLVCVATTFGALSSLIWGLGMTLTVFAIACCTLAAAQIMAEKPTEGRFVVVGAVQVVSLLALDMVFAAQAGTSVHDVIVEQVEVIVEQMQAMPGVTLADMKSFGQLVEAAGNYWPVVYLIQGASLTLTSVVVSALARRRVDPTYATAVKPFAQFDSSPHILWPLVIGLWCISVSYMLPEYHIPLTCAAALCLIVARILCGVQGAALVKSALDRRESSTGLRVAVWILAGLLDVTFMLITLFGLFDIWTNMRRLERDDMKDDTKVQNG